MGFWKRPYGSFVSLVLAIFLLVSCAGLGFDVWGTVTSEAQFTEIEYIGSEAVPVVGSNARTTLIRLIFRAFRPEGGGAAGRGGRCQRVQANRH